jgi:hypothetical protein
MRIRNILIFLILVGFLSCKKDGSQTTPKLQPALQAGQSSATGTLSYACVCVDGGGLIYATDDKKILVFNDSLADMTNFDDSMTTKYNDFLDVHTRLVYQNKGVTRCNYGMIANQCLLDSVVKIVSFTKF